MVIGEIHPVQAYVYMAMRGASWPCQKACLFSIQLHWEVVTSTRSESDLSLDICVCHCTVFCLQVSQAFGMNEGEGAIFTQKQCEIACLSRKCHTQTYQMVFQVLVFRQTGNHSFHKASADAERCIENTERSCFSTKQTIFHKSIVVSSACKWLCVR